VSVRTFHWGKNRSTHIQAPRAAWLVTRTTEISAEKLGDLVAPGEHGYDIRVRCFLSIGRYLGFGSCAPSRPFHYGVDRTRKLPRPVKAFLSDFTVGTKGTCQTMASLPRNYRAIFCIDEQALSKGSSIHATYRTLKEQGAGKDRYRWPLFSGNQVNLYRTNLMKISARKGARSRRFIPGYGKLDEDPFAAKSASRGNYSVTDSLPWQKRCPRGLFRISGSNTDGTAIDLENEKIKQARQELSCIRPQTDSPLTGSQKFGRSRYLCTRAHIKWTRNDPQEAGSIVRSIFPI